MESSLRQAFILSEGTFDIFWTRPIAAALLAAAIVITLSSFASTRTRGWRERLMAFSHSKKAAQ